MSGPPEFSQETIKTMASRAGYKCSFPGCRRSTIGPSSENITAVSNIGMACHIVPRGNTGPARRIDASFTDKMKADISNGIWMCYTHGKLIDTDEIKYSSDTLRAWQALAHRIAEFELTHQRPPDQGEIQAFGLKFGEIIALTSIHDGRENQIIGDAIEESGVTISWGEVLSAAVRDLCIELARNAHLHGGASEFRMEIKDRSIRLMDNGAIYDIWQLLVEPNAREGSGTLRYLLDKHSDQIVVSTERVPSGNCVVIALLSDLIKGVCSIPCSLKLTRADFFASHSESMMATHIVTKSCRGVIIVLPDYLAASDLMLVSLRTSPFAELVAAKCQLTVVAPGASARVLERLREQLKNVIVVGAPPASKRFMPL